MSADPCRWRSTGRRLSLIACFAALLFASNGCWKAAPTPPVPPPAPPVMSKSDPDATPSADATAANEMPRDEVESSDDAGTSSEEASDDGSPAPDQVSTDVDPEGGEALSAPGDGDATETAAASVPSYEADARLLVATPGGPTIVDADLIVDGESPQQALDAFVQEIVQLADTNDDGTPTWDEVFADPVFKAGTLGNDAIPGEPEAQRARELYDTNRDNVVQGDEVPRFVTRNAGAARPFSLQTANFFRFYQRTESALRLIADVDRDGKLTRAELAAAPRELSVYDADDDEILTADEIEIDDRESFREQRLLNARSDPETALLLDDRLKKEDLRRWLSETYALGGSLEPGIFSDRPELEATLDANADGKFDQDELAVFRTLPADVVVRVEFGAAVDSSGATVDSDDPGYAFMQEGASATRVEIVRAPTAVDDGSLEGPAGVRAPASVPSRTLVEANGFLLRIAANDGAPSYGQAQAVFRQTDTNGDDRIDKAERDASPFLLQVPAEAVDLDSDEIYTLKEVTGYFRRVAGSQRAKVRALAMEDRDAVLVALDANLDGRLQPGERAGLETLLDRYDANADDQVSVGELPTAISLVFVRGDLQQSEQLFRQAPTRVASGAGDAPAWLSMMDRNEDGVVTRREFPGPPEKFGELDLDGDGEIVPSEAASATVADDSAESPAAAVSPEEDASPDQEGQPNTEEDASP